MINLAKRSLTSMAWVTVGNSLAMVILFGRSVILIRRLPVETFGAYGFAVAIVAATSVLAKFGMGSAF